MSGMKCVCVYFWSNLWNILFCSRPLPQNADVSSSLFFFLSVVLILACVSLSSPLPRPFLSSAVEAFEDVSDSLCIPQYNADGEERVILFLKMAPGKPFRPELVARIKGAIRKALSARHVPALLLETKDIPVREM